MELDSHKPPTKPRRNGIGLPSSKVEGNKGSGTQVKGYGFVLLFEVLAESKVAKGNAVGPLFKG